MIKNERQLRVATTKLTALQHAREVAEDKTGWRAYTDLIDDLSADIAQYEDARDGKTQTFDLKDLDGLGEAVIKARISRGWTHKQLAELMGVTEQQVQKDEARDYEKAGLARIAEVLDVLGYELVGTVRRRGVAPANEGEDGASMSTSVSATFSSKSMAPGDSEDLRANLIRLAAPLNTVATERIATWVNRTHERAPQ